MYFSIIHVRIVIDYRVFLNMKQYYTNNSNICFFIVRYGCVYGETYNGDSQGEH